MGRTAKGSDPCWPDFGNKRWLLACFFRCFGGDPVDLNDQICSRLVCWLHIFFYAVVYYDVARTARRRTTSSSAVRWCVSRNHRWALRKTNCTRVEGIALSPIIFLWTRRAFLVTACSSSEDSPRCISDCCRMFVERTTKNQMFSIACCDCDCRPSCGPSWLCPVYLMVWSPQCLVAAFIWYSVCRSGGSDVTKKWFRPRRVCLSAVVYLFVFHVAAV